MDHKAIADSLEAKGYIVIENAFSSELLEALHFVALHTKYSEVAIGRGLKKKRVETIRSGETSWIDGSTQAGADYLEQMSLLRTAMNQLLFMGLFEYEAHFSRYKKGEFYKKHLDALLGGRNRVLTSVLYLNKTWDEKSGGALVIYGKDEQILETLVPIWGRMVLFLSEEFAHEVLPPKQDRYGIAGWFRVREFDVL